MAVSWEDLPEECWEAIFGHLKSSQHHLESLSLVCKSFTSISNRIRSTLTISDRTVLIPRDQGISNLFHRFHHIKRIHVVDFHGHLDRLIRDISRSDLKLEALDLSNAARIPASSMKELGSRMKTTMKTLICANLLLLDNRDLMVIADSFPALEVLDISYPLNDLGSCFPELQDDLFPRTVTDIGIEALSLKLQKLRSIKLSGNSFISDHSLISLSKNCASLSEIVARSCSFLTSNGIDFVIRNRSNLVSLSVNGNMISSSPDTIRSFHSYARALHCLDLSQMLVSDDLLLVIGEANIPLQKLVLSLCRGFTFVGISTLLRMCRSIRHLDLEGMDFLTDEKMCKLSEYLQYLISIGLSSCTRLTSATLFNLAKNCPSLDEIRMQNTSLGKENLVPDFMKKSRIRSLKLAWNKYLCDQTLVRIASVCSRLKSLDVSHCWSITDVGIGGIGKCCTEITELKVEGCGQVLSLGSGLGFSKLEVLTASTSGIGDEGLGMIGRGCRRLRMLNLQGCLGVTEKGVKEIVGSDSGRKFLRELNLRDCCNMSADVLAWIVFSSPSLKKIVAPSDSVPTMKQRDLFLRHGCMVSKF